ncbi:alkane 1-monooxygenase [Spongisporangium articulatum]|uniref:Alkane 1-monooxygenase n=1 Tax=Spongisporangium articulatum TaxID=3362603 RepID=A0ABW8ASQ8_9ACTN
MSAAAGFLSDARARAWRDTKRFMWPSALFVPVLPYVGYGIASHSGRGIFWYLTPAIVFILIPVIDGFVGDDGGNPPEELVAALQEDRYYRWMTFLYLPLQYGGLVLGTWVFVQPETTWFARVGIILSCGTVSGIAINTAHELGHKREDLERWLSKIALAASWYGHFYVEHNRGHHVRVATVEDPASARMGESFYAFWPRTVWGSLRSAVSLEWKRFRLRGRNPWTIKNDVLNAWLMSLVLYAVLVGFFGPLALVFLIPQSIIGFSLLEVVNYLEHYGLLRKKNEAGRYEKVNPLHSWNSNRLATNLFLYELQRHSDHHANPTRRYQVLRHFDESPQLPAGYARMIVFALVPPLWFHSINPLVVQHYGGDLTQANIHPRKRDKILARYATAGPVAGSGSAA